MQRGKGSKGYVYYRDRSNGNDSTVYEHQLMACLDHDPCDVFDPEIEVHHHTPIRDFNVQWLLSLIDAEEHRSRRRDRKQFQAPDDFPTPNGDEISLISVESDSDGVVETMADD